MRSTSSSRAVTKTTGRPVAARAQRAAHLEPVDPGHPDVEHDRDRPQPRDRGERARAVRLDVHAEARVRQVEPLEVGDRRLVLDDQHQALVFAHLPILAARVPAAAAVSQPPYRFFTFRSHSSNRRRRRLVAMSHSRSRLRATSFALGRGRGTRARRRTAAATAADRHAAPLRACRPRASRPAAPIPGIFTDTCERASTAPNDPIMMPGMTGIRCSTTSSAIAAVTASSTAAAFAVARRPVRPRPTPPPTGRRWSTRTAMRSLRRARCSTGGRPRRPLRARTSMPSGISLIAGNETATAPQSSSVVDWTCTTTDADPRPHRAEPAARLSGGIATPACDHVPELLGRPHARRPGPVRRGLRDGQWMPVVAPDPHPSDRDARQLPDEQRGGDHPLDRAEHAGTSGHRACRLRQRLEPAAHGRRHGGLRHRSGALRTGPRRGRRTDRREVRTASTR